MSAKPATQRTAESVARRKERGEVRIVPPAFWVKADDAERARADAKLSSHKLRRRYTSRD